jgi:hypothetical protein
LIWEGALIRLVETAELVSGYPWSNGGGSCSPAAGAYRVRLPLLVRLLLARLRPLLGQGLLVWEDIVQLELRAIHSYRADETCFFAHSFWAFGPRHRRSP